jgi:hypothetical protein
LRGLYRATGRRYVTGNHQRGGIVTGPNANAPAFTTGNGYTAMGPNIGYLGCASAVYAGAFPATIAITLASSYTANEVGFTLYNVEPGSDNYTATAYSGTTAVVATQTATVPPMYENGMAAFDLVAPVGKTITSVTVTSNQTYGAGVFWYIIDNITLNKAIVGAGTQTDTTKLSVPSTAQVGQSVTASVTVTPTSGRNVPTGQVTITGGGAHCTATLDSSGAGSCTLTFATAGTYTLTASYAGDAHFAPSSTTADITVTSTGGTGTGTGGTGTGDTDTGSSQGGGGAIGWLWGLGLWGLAILGWKRRRA